MSLIGPEAVKVMEVESDDKNRENTADVETSELTEVEETPKLAKRAGNALRHTG